MSSAPPRRRRGAALDRALLTAAWEELMADGYENLTLEAVADRAATSRPVIARRWPDRKSLAIAAIRHWFDSNPLATPDTGSLRGDLLAYLEDKSNNRAELMSALPIRIAALIHETGIPPGQFFPWLGIDPTVGLDEIWDRAAQRGDVDLAVLHPRLRTLAFDLVAAEVARSHESLAPGVIEEILDVIVLPLTQPIS